MKKAQTQPKAVQGTAVAKIEQKPTPALIVLPKQEEPTSEELKKEIEALRRKISSVPENLADRIEYYNQKKEWIKKLDKIKVQRDKLLQIESEVNDEIEIDEFISENFAIAIFRKKNYGGDDELFKIQNPALVGVVLKNVLSKMKEKIDELEINIAN